MNDVYVVERVLAAVAGACLRDPSPQRLSTSAASIWRHVFAKKVLPTHVLLRDYARLTIELAAERGLLLDECDLARCRPPYGSTAPRFGLNKAKVEAECEAAGDYNIFRSTAEWGGDFGTYVVEGRARAFTSTRLTKPQPLRYEEAFEQFRKNFVDGDEFRSTLVSILEMTAEVHARGLNDDTDRGENDYWVKARRRAEEELLRQLGPHGRRHYHINARPFLEGRMGWLGSDDNELGLIDQEQARLWIARRAIRLGWTKRRFPQDHGAGDESRRSTRIERVGKKYQWIAYHELVARLADNYWLAPEWGLEPIKAYDTPLDLPYIRDIEPTVRPGADEDEESARPGLPIVPRLAIGEVATADMNEWVFEDGIAAERLGLGLLSTPFEY